MTFEITDGQEGGARVLTSSRSGLLMAMCNDLVKWCGEPRSFRPPFGHTLREVADFFDATDTPYHASGMEIRR